MCGLKTKVPSSTQWEETQRPTEAQKHASAAGQNWKFVEEAILLKTVEQESKFHGKMTGFTRLGLQWLVNYQSLSLWSVWGNWGTAKQCWTMKLVRWEVIQSNHSDGYKTQFSAFLLLSMILPRASSIERWGITRKSLFTGPPSTRIKAIILRKV